VPGVLVFAAFACLALMAGASVLAGCGATSSSGASVSTPASISAASTSGASTSTSGANPQTAAQSQPVSLKLAVEFTDHAACAMVAEEKGWFEDEGLNITSVENYVTGTDLAAALARGDIQAAYICLVPAINARANGGVDIKVVAGTHKYGYALVGNPSRISSTRDLAKPDIRLACTQAGTACDVLLQRLCEENNLPASQIGTATQRMNPPAQVLALQAGKVDACFVPEHWATLAEGTGCKVLALSQDIWPDMQGSVLVVKEEFIRQHPEVVEKLVRVTQRSTAWIIENPGEAADILANMLSVTGHTVLPDKAAESAAKLSITPGAMKQSMSRLKYDTSVDPTQVQATIDFMNRLGYLKKNIQASDLLDLRFMQ